MKRVALALTLATACTLAGPVAHAAGDTLPIGPTTPSTAHNTSAPTSNGNTSNGSSARSLLETLAAHGQYTTPAQKTHYPSEAISNTNGVYTFDIRWQQQLTPYYCGPAAAAMALSTAYPISAAGEFASQETLAHDQYLKTDYYGMTPGASLQMLAGLNAWVGSDVYHLASHPNGEQLRHIVLDSFTTTGRPVILEAYETPYGIQYNNHPVKYTGHYVTVIGFDTNTDELVIADPAAGIAMYEDAAQTFRYNVNDFAANFLNDGHIGYGAYY